jgi:hypothetical protein
MILITAWLAAIVVANLLIVHDPRWAIINGAALIGFDLTARDRLDDRWQKHRVWKMSALILVGAGISYAINADTRAIAGASACAFALGFTADWIAYSKLRLRPWLERSIWSAVPSSILDSIAFPYFALLFGFPGLWDPFIVGGLIAAKIGGAAFWALVLQPRVPESVRRRHEHEIHAYEEAIAYGEMSPWET